MLNLNGNQISPENGPFVRNYGSADSAAIKNDSAVQTARDTNNIHEINLTDLKVGDVFRGEILNINNHEVSILLNDNSIINALLKQSFELNIGQNVMFQVREKSESQLFIRPLPEDTVSPELIQKSLSAAGLSVNDKNSLIVSSLIEQGQPIDRQTVLLYMRLSNQFGLENMDKLIDMTKQGLTINQENLEMYDKYVNSTHQISDIISNLPEQLTGYLENLMDGSMDGVMPEMKAFINMLDELSEVLEGTDMSEAENTDMFKQIESDINAAADKAFTEETLSVKDEVQMDEKTGELEKSTVAPKNTVIMNNSDNVKSSEVAEHFGPETHTNSMKNTDNVNQAGTIKNQTDEGRIPDSSFKENSRINENSPADKIISNNIESHGKNNDSFDTLKDVARDILSMLEHENGAEYAGKKQDLAKIKERIRDIFKDKLMIDASSDSKTEEIKQQVEKLYEKLSKTADIIKNHIPAQKDNPLSSGANDLKNNLNFMNELNKLESYVQLPVKFGAEDANGDLYVYNRRKNKRSGEEPLTAFLHFDLTYLGATDIHVSLKNKGVKIVFTLDNEASEKLIVKHLGELIERLEEKGYRAAVDANSVKKESDSGNNALLPITNHNDNIVSIKRYT
ncbi:MAG: flagellar hook-length control protein FliK, partial [Lachnospiraceae bacterium]|nr:flagellar hook-length control protein FliK [Lachnospiraceae bacterium]